MYYLFRSPSGGLCWRTALLETGSDRRSLYFSLSSSGSEDWQILKNGIIIFWPTTSVLEIVFRIYHVSVLSGQTNASVSLQTSDQWTTDKTPVARDLSDSSSKYCLSSLRGVFDTTASTLHEYSTFFPQIHHLCDKFCRNRITAKMIFALLFLVLHFSLIMFRFLHFKRLLWTRITRVSSPHESAHLLKRRKPRRDGTHREEWSLERLFL